MLVEELPSFSEYAEKGVFPVPLFCALLENGVEVPNPVVPDEPPNPGFELEVLEEKMPVPVLEPNPDLF